MVKIDDIDSFSSCGLNGDAIAQNAEMNCFIEEVDVPDAPMILLSVVAVLVGIIYGAADVILLHRSNGSGAKVIPEEIPEAAVVVTPSATRTEVTPGISAVLSDPKIAASITPAVVVEVKTGEHSDGDDGYGDDDIAQMAEALKRKTAGEKRKMSFLNHRDDIYAQI